MSFPPSRGCRDLNPVPGDLNALATETIASFQTAHAGVEFVLELEPSLPRILIDRESLKRALINLLDNAVSATSTVARNGHGPRIELRTSLDSASGVVMLEVRDNGPGISPALRTRIFEPYFSTKHGGTGLGLAIVSAIVTDHHGFVRVADNAPAGSRFILEFPVKEGRFHQGRELNRCSDLNYRLTLRTMRLCERVPNSE